MKNSDTSLYVGLAILVVIVAAATYYWDKVAPPPVSVTPSEAPAPAEAPADVGPRYPMPEQQATPEGARNLVPLPPLDDSDAYFLLEIGAAFGPAVESLLLREAVIDRLVTTVDNLPRGHVSDRIRPVGRLEQSFRTDAGNGDTAVLGPSSFARYDALVLQIANANVDAAYDTYRRFYPLFQKAYERLGYPSAYFNDRLIEVIDHLVAAPSSTGPIVLHRPNVLYEFADPDLEALSSGQKIMLRMGPDNAATIKQVLEDFRARLTQP